MTTRHSAYLVTLAEDIREDDAQTLITALGMLKGVLDVRPVEADHAHLIAAARRDTEWTERLHALIRDMPR